MFNPNKILRNLIIFFVVCMFLSEFGVAILHGIGAMMVGGIKLFIKGVIDIILTILHLK